MTLSNIKTESEIEDQVRLIGGTWVKRRNERSRLKSKSNAEVNERILICRGKIRNLRAIGARECDLRDWYAEITKLELMLLE